MIDNKIRLIINVLQWILIVLSAIALVYILINIFSLQFDLTEESYQTFLGLFKPYSFLFGATFLVISINLALIRTSMAHDANLNSYMTSSRTAWMQTIKEFYSEIKSKDPFIVKEFNKNLAAIHDFLFMNGFSIKSKKELDSFFNRFFKNKIDLFEKMNKDLQNVNCYSSETHSYSYPAFEYLLYVALEFKNCYEGFRDDLFNMYLDEVKKVQQEYIVDYEAYNKRMVKLITNK